jgi:hypothetical protein
MSNRTLSPQTADPGVQFAEALDGVVPLMQAIPA